MGSVTRRLRRVSMGKATVHVPIELIGYGLGRNAESSTPLLDLKPSFFHSKGLTILEQTTGHDLVLEDGTLSQLAERPKVPIWKIRPCLKALTTARPSATKVMGFSQNVHPCAGMDMLACQWGGVAMATKSRSLRKQFAEVLINSAFLCSGIGESLGAVEVDVRLRRSLVPA